MESFDLFFDRPSSRRGVENGDRLLLHATADQVFPSANKQTLPFYRHTDHQATERDAKRYVMPWKEMPLQFFSTVWFWTEFQRGCCGA